MTLRWQDLPEYHAPPLHATRRSTITFVVASAVGGIWSIALAIILTARGESSRRLDETAAWDILTWSGLTIVVSTAIAGAWWCDVRTRNLHLLEGRFPSRNRAIRAWLIPLAVVLLLYGTVLRTDPTEVVDIRPAIVVFCYALAVWRPYSLLRRLFRSMSRVRENGLVIAVGVLQPTAWGALWWQLASNSGTRSGDNFDGLTGIAWASSIALAAAAILVVLIDRAMQRAQDRRIMALQVRDEHRYVRSLGLNPFDAEVYTELAKVKLERTARRSSDIAPVEGAVERPTPTVDDVTRPARGPLRVPDEFVQEAARTARQEPAEVTGPAPIEPTLPPRAIDAADDSEPADAGAVPEDQAAVGDAGRADEPERDLALAATTHEPDRTDQDASEDGAGDDGTGDDGADSPDELDATTLGAPEAARRPRRRWRRGRPEPEVAQPPEPASDTDADPAPSAADPETEPPTAAAAAVASIDPDHPSSPPKGRARRWRRARPVEEPVTAPDSRPSPAGDHEVEPSEDVDVSAQHAPDEPPINTATVMAAEGSRYLAVGSLIAVALCSLWVVVTVIDLSGPVRDGSMSPVDVTRIDRSLAWTTRSVLIALPAQALWTWIATVAGSRIGATDVRASRVGTFAVGSAMFAALAIALEDSSGFDLLALLGAVVCAERALVSTMPLIEWLERRRNVGLVWSIGLGTLALVIVVWGAYQPIEPTASIAVLAFFGFAQSQVAALVAIVAGALTLEYEDEIRSRAIDLSDDEQLADLP